MINVGDIVRVISDPYENAAIEGTVTRVVQENGWASEITVNLPLNNYVEKFDITVLSRDITVPIGSTVTAKGMTYTKYGSAMLFNWIDTSGRLYTWSEVLAEL